MAEKGYIYKGLKPIYWSPSSESSLAEAEIEYKDVKSASIYVAFQIKDGKGLLDNRYCNGHLDDYALDFAGKLRHFR